GPTRKFPPRPHPRLRRSPLPRRGRDPAAELRHPHPPFRDRPPTEALTPRAAGRWTRVQLRRAAASILAEGLRAADPGALVRRWLRAHGSALPAPRTRGRLLLVAAGQAAPPMAKAPEEILRDRIPPPLPV